MVIGLAESDLHDSSLSDAAKQLLHDVAPAFCPSAVVSAQRLGKADVNRS